MRRQFKLILKSLVLFFFASIVFYLSISVTNISSEEQNKNAPNLAFSESDSNNKLTIAVYYETKCTDSSRFFNEQLSNAIKLFSNLINIVLIPYGNANVNNLFLMLFVLNILKIKIII